MTCIACGKPKKSRKSPWRPIRTASTNPLTIDEVDLWLVVNASPMSMGISDAFRVPDCTRRNGKWGHYQRSEWMELNQDLITHWMPVPKGPK